MDGWQDYHTCHFMARCENTSSTLKVYKSILPRRGEDCIKYTANLKIEKPELLSLSRLVHTMDVKAKLCKSRIYEPTSCSCLQVRAGEGQSEADGYVFTNPVYKTSMYSGLTPKARQQVASETVPRLRALGACTEVRSDFRIPDGNLLRNFLGNREIPIAVVSWWKSDQKL